MKKDQECYLYLAILNGGTGSQHVYVRDIVNKMIEDGIVDNYKQPVATLEKWYGKGVYECGVSILAGWLTITNNPTQKQLDAHIKLRKELSIEKDIGCIT